MKKHFRRTVSSILTIAMLLSLSSCAVKTVETEKTKRPASSTKEKKDDDEKEYSTTLAGGITSDTSAEESSEMSDVDPTTPPSENDPGNESQYYDRFPNAEVYQAKFLGVSDWGAPETKKENADKFTYRFEVNGEIKTYSIDNSELDGSGVPLYPIQNQLKEGYTFEIYVQDGTVVGVNELNREALPSYQPRVSGIPGEKTVLNFIKTAMMPVGTTLYMFGGGWDWQDTGSAIQSRTIGVSGDWIKFFNEHNENYTFRDKDGDSSKKDPRTSYYPYGGFNQYYYAGLDCSGFVGWVVYNTMNTKSGNSGYVVTSTKLARSLSDTYGWGEFSQKLGKSDPSGYKVRPGDVISVKGHVWISLGTCDDGSIVIVHSTSGYKSKTGQPGGGVAIGAIGSSKNCQAYQLASSYMSKYYPEWYRRYDLTLSDPGYYLTIEGDTAGRFSWNTSAANGLSDAEGVQNMKPDQVLKLCFGE